MEEEVLAKVKISSEYEEAGLEAQMANRGHNELRGELRLARQEAKDFKEGMRREAGVADGLRRGIVALTSELDEARSLAEHGGFDPARFGGIDSSWNFGSAGGA